MQEKPLMEKYLEKMTIDELWDLFKQDYTNKKNYLALLKMPPGEEVPTEENLKNLVEASKQMTTKALDFKKVSENLLAQVPMAKDAQKGLLIKIWQ